MLPYYTRCDSITNLNSTIIHNNGIFYFPPRKRDVIAYASIGSYVDPGSYRRVTPDDARSLTTAPLEIRDPRPNATLPCIDPISSSVPSILGVIPSSTSLLESSMSSGVPVSFHHPSTFR